LTNIAYYDIRERRIFEDREEGIRWKRQLAIVAFMPQTAKNSGITEVMPLFSQIAESSAAQDFRGGRNADR
jgi:hypothetical protein